MIDFNETREKAREVLNEKIRDGGKYKRDFEDSESWEQLAKEYGIRLPAWWMAPEPRYMRRYLRMLKIKERDYCMLCGDGWALESFGNLNPTYPLRAFVGNLLEYHAEVELAKEKLNNIN